MTLADFLARLVAALEAADVAYMLAGSLASSFHGEPRATQDVDVVIHTDSDGVDRLLSQLPDESYYVDRGAALDALATRGQFNVIDLATGWKADLIVRKSREFSIREFDRRVRAQILAVDLWVASAEDVVVSKLEWSARSGSTRQLRDVVGVITTTASLDMGYVERWTTALGLDEQLQAALETTSQGDP